MTLSTLRSSTFLSNERGSISIMFGAAIIAMVGVVGLSIDVGRSMDAHSKAASALDSAVLAATRAVFSGDKSVGEIETLAANFFEGNLSSVGDIGADYSDFTADVDTETKTVKARTTVHVPTTFGAIFGVNKISYTVASSATFNIQDIELSLVLDLTGSMCQPCSKIDALKDASKELIDALMPENGGASEVKIALAPYSASVNAGPLTEIATAGRSTDGCLVERDGTFAYDDVAPPADYADVTDADIVSGYIAQLRRQRPHASVRHRSLRGQRNSYSCPNAELVPLSTDKDMLKDRGRRFQHRRLDGRPSRHRMGLVHDLRQLGRAAARRELAQALRREEPDQGYRAHDRRRLQHRLSERPTRRTRPCRSATP